MATIRHVRGRIGQSCTSFSSTLRPAGPEISRKDAASRPSVVPSCRLDRGRQDRVACTSVQRTPRLPLPPMSSRLFCRGGGAHRAKASPHPVRGPLSGFFPKKWVFLQSVLSLQQNSRRQQTSKRVNSLNSEKAIQHSAYL
ncbi:hypothetical protein NDU88_001557 [Pleurodeles waltl]|uniref:Uncharacterized protein n=1 Tax=Pleurodeles waltl TaxID=8319 RepID=A0AAV7MKU6_PLEWA|nr:hypothetical protein NDU88_001557 [Pleurodeles waltl]